MGFFVSDWIVPGLKSGILFALFEPVILHEVIIMMIPQKRNVFFIKSNLSIY